MPWREEVKGDLMAVLNLVLVLISSLLAMQASGEESELPEWTQAPAEPNLFVVETKEFSTHYDVTNGLLPAVKTGVANWAKKSFGADCEQVIESIALDDFRDLIYEDQQIVHEFRRIYDAETAKRLEAEYDIYYRGYVRVNISETFRDQVQQNLKTLRLKRRLCTTLISGLFVIGVASITWCYLYTNRLSRGFYIGRIRWIAGALVVSLILICYVVCQLLF